MKVKMRLLQEIVDMPWRYVRLIRHIMKYKQNTMEQKSEMLKTYAVIKNRKDCNKEDKFWRSVLK